MKKMLLIALACLLLAVSTALANGWGLKGGAYDVISQDDRYEGYTAVADDGNDSLTDVGQVNHVVMENRYDAFLMAVSRTDKGWQADVVNHAAVYQPGDEWRAYLPAPQLEHTGDGFRLSYGEKENYTFLWNGEEYVLSDVRYEADTDYADCYMLVKEGLEFWHSNPEGSFLPIGDGMWPAVITLEEFNITQMPRYLSHLRQLTMTANALMDAPRLKAAAVWEGVKDGATLAVYSAPDASSFRAAEGKASVSLGGDITIYGTVDGWTLVGYEVSPRTSRIGYVNRELSEEPLAFGEVALRASMDTFLTDDPFVSQYAQVKIPEGARLTGLTQCGEYYAYVEYQADKLYRGFVPLKDLMPVYDLALSVDGDVLTEGVIWSLMEALCGKWFPESGPAAGETILFSNGSFSLRKDGQYTAHGNYRIYQEENEQLTIRFITEDNQEKTCSLTLNEDGTITMDDQVLYRVEYSTYGNG